MSVYILLHYLINLLVLFALVVASPMFVIISCSGMVVNYVEFP